MGAWKGLDEGGREVIRYFGPAEEAHARAQGFVPASPTEAAQATGAIDDTTGGALGVVGAGVSSALSGATLGASDVALRGLLSDAEMGRLAADRAAHPILSGAGQLAGAVAPALLSGGAALPSSLAARAGAGVVEDLGGGIAARAAGGTVEGALYGAGQGVSELALSQDRLTYERAASVLSSNMLYGGAIGGGLGAGGALLERGLQRAKGAIDNAMARKVVEDTTPDLASLDGRGLGKARDVELERLETERVPLRQQLVSDVQGYRERTIEVGLKDAAQEGMAIGEVREANAAFSRASKDLRQALDNRAGLAESPERLLGILQRQEQAMGTIKVWSDSAVAGWDAKARALPDQIRSEIIAGKVPGFVPSALTPRGLDAAVERVMMDRYGNLIGPEFPKSLRIADDHLGGALEKNRELQQRIRTLASEPTSQRLTEIDAAKDALGVAKPKSLGQQILGMAAHAVGGPAAVVASTGAKVLGGLKEAVAKVTERAGAAASSFLGTGAKVATRAPLATKVLAGVSFAPRADKDADTGARPASGLPQLFKARTDEIKALTAYDETGVPRLRPEARQAMAQRLRPITAADPILADRIETLAARRIEYLSSLIPRRPDIAGAPIGPDRWQPSDMEMRSWARSVAAVEDPHGVLERATHGNVTPEDIGAMVNVHPEILADWTRDVSMQLSALRKSLPQPRKLALSLLTGQPVDPATDPAILSVFQAQYQYEPGPAPTAAPQFGSVKNRAEVGTPSQRREEGTA